MDYNKMLKILDHKNANKPLMGVWVKKNIRLCMNCYFVIKEFDLLKQKYYVTRNPNNSNNTDTSSHTNPSRLILSQSLPLVDTRLIHLFYIVV